MSKKGLGYILWVVWGITISSIIGYYKFISPETEEAFRYTWTFALLFPISIVWLTIGWGFIVWKGKGD